MLDQLESEKLIKAAQNGDENAKTLLLKENSPLIKSIIRRYKGRGIEYDDLYQLGCLGFLKAIRNFSFDFDVKYYHETFNFHTFNYNIDNFLFCPVRLQWNRQHRK